MENFANQCLDMAQSILSHNLDAIQEDGSITAVGGEASLPQESGHAALAIGEYYRATQELKLGDYDLLDLCARTISAQTFNEDEANNGLSYASLALLSFGPAKDRNLVWERLLDETRECLDTKLLARSDYSDHRQAFNIAQAVARFSMGMSKKDDTGKLIDKFIENIQANSSNGFCDDSPENSFGGVFDIYGALNFIFIRQALQLHANIHLRERKLPTLRTFAEKYIKMLPDMVRHDGLGWAFGQGIGAYGQMHCISIILQAMRDGWISEDKKPQYFDILRRLFQFFFMTYLDQEHGYLVISDEERRMNSNHSTRMANFDAARYLCQWSRLAKSIGGVMEPKAPANKTTGRFVVFDKNYRKEQGLFIYQDAKSGLHLTIPLVGSKNNDSSDCLAFPHSPGVFDWPVEKYMPVLMPELTFGEHVTVPAFYGKHCTTGLGLRNSFQFRYEQPDLITKDQELATSIGSCKVNWTFSGDKITSEYTYTVKSPIQLDSMRYVIALSAPHSQYRLGTTFTLGQESLRASVEKDDFQAKWDEIEVVSDDPEFRTYYGKIHYLQTLKRDHPLIMRPGQQYRLVVTFQPDLAMADE